MMRIYCSVLEEIKLSHTTVTVSVLKDHHCSGCGYQETLLTPNRVNSRGVRKANANKVGSVELQPVPYDACCTR